MSSPPGSIPADVLTRMARSIDVWLEPGSEEQRLLRCLLSAYAAQRKSAREPEMRAQLCELFTACQPACCCGLLTEVEYETLERCARGGVFAGSHRR